jgi:hypothetical protein
MKKQTLYSFCMKLCAIGLLISYGVTDNEAGLIQCAKNNIIKHAQYFVTNGARNFNKALVRAILSESTEVMDYMIQMGADNVDEALDIAITKHHRNTVSTISMLYAVRRLLSARADVNKGMDKVFKTGHETNLTLIPIFMEHGLTDLHKAIAMYHCDRFVKVSVF